MLVYFRPRLLESVLNDCNERIVSNDLNMIRSSDSEDENDNSISGGGSVSGGDQHVSSTQMPPNRAHY
jgi:IS5 family transposase